MKIEKLAIGKEAPPETDCILIEEGSDGKFRLNASALDVEESVAIVGGGPYATFEEAEAAGLAWADSHGVETVYVEHMRSGAAAPLH
ncbi:hypothetical protein [Sphingomonas crusticola]|uniref:hypothetical protein n=1 Tax=Sphingomonas crusticola TaxID=1697973 RepID=UPI000E274418|nr:hypothetical protein [Sphingomonas crusticola]